MSGIRRLIFSILYINFCLIFTADSRILNENVDRTIDISTQLVKESYKISVEESSDASIKEYEFVLPIGDYKEVAFLSVKDGLKQDLKYKTKEKEGNVHLTITFKTPAPKQTVYVDYILTKKIIPHPKEIKQNEKHLVKYAGNVYFYSPYETKQQKTLVKLSSSNIISYTQTKPTSVSGSKIKYGPYEDIPAFSQQVLTIHYENQTPFLTVTSLDRSIEVSHWGNVAIKEDIYLSHTGAKLKGPFSRYEFQKNGRSGQFAIESYKTILPASASSVYYRDTNGNISTSNMRILRDSVELELKPRFPLFGGWKTHYTLGYNVPSFEYLYKSDENYMLKMRLIDHVFDDMVIEEATIKIILPEGTSNIQLTTPYSVERHSNKLFHTYLDTIGRPVVSISKKNLVENHIQDFELRYKFSSISLLQEPLLIIGFVFVIFVLTIIFLRLDFSINTHPHKD